MATLAGGVSLSESYNEKLPEIDCKMFYTNIAIS